MMIMAGLNWTLTWCLQVRAARKIQRWSRRMMATKRFMLRSKLGLTWHSMQEDDASALVSAVDERPAWFCEVVYGFSLLWIIACVLTTVLLGYDFRPRAASQWLHSVGLAVTLDILLVAPAKILAIVVFNHHKGSNR